MNSYSNRTPGIGGIIGQPTMQPNQGIGQQAASATPPPRHIGQHERNAIFLQRIMLCAGYALALLVLHQIR